MQAIRPPMPVAGGQAQAAGDRPRGLVSSLYELSAASCSPRCASFDWAAPPGRWARQRLAGGGVQRGRLLRGFFDDGKALPGDTSGNSGDNWRQGLGGAEGKGGDRSTWETWEQWSDVPEDWDGDWEPWEKPDTSVNGKRGPWRYPRRLTSAGRPRDEYLRPIVDFSGIRDRLSADSIGTEERIIEEFERNQLDSQQALWFAGKLIAVPLVIGFVISRLTATPLIAAAENFSEEAFALTDAQKVEGAHEVHLEELKLRMEAALGRAPALQGDELQAHLREEALHIAAEKREHNKAAYLNLISDSISATTFFVLLVRDSEGRRVLFSAIGRVFRGLSDTAKAFIFIVVTDTLLGYHSEDGWTATIRLIGMHYGVEVEEGPVYLFVATVPVFLDSLFKYWLFTGLNKQDPAAAVTLKQMDRH